LTAYDCEVIDHGYLANPIRWGQFQVAGGKFGGYLVGDCMKEGEVEKGLFCGSVGDTIIINFTFS